jgi:hypothetical protein
VRLIDSALRGGAAEVVEHQRERLLRERVLERGDRVEARIELHVPAAAVELLRGLVEQRLGAVGVELAGNVGLEIEPHAANAGRVHLVNLVARRRRADHGNGTSACAESFGCFDRQLVVVAIDARLHDHDAIEPQRFLQVEQFFDGRGRRRVDAPFRIGLDRRIEDVDVTVARVWRYVEIDRRLLRHFCVRKNRAQRNGAETGITQINELSSGQHDTPPPILVNERLTQFWVARESTSCRPTDRARHTARKHRQNLQEKPHAHSTGWIGD